MKKNPKVLVTGANGQLGLTLQEISLKETFIDWVFLSSKELNITIENHVKDKIKGFDFIINCAAYTNVEKAEEEKEKAFSVNFKGVKNIVNVIKNSKTILIQISTDYVFDGKTTIPIKENDKTNPVNIYGKSKLAGEQEVVNSLDRYYILRTSWLYSNFGNNFYKTIKQRVSKNMPMQIVSSQFGAPTSTIDLSRAIIHIIKKNVSNFGIYHFSNGGFTNWYIFAKKIVQLIDEKKLSYISEVETFKTKAKRPINSKLNSEKFENIFNYQIPSWQEALLEVIKTSPK